MEMLDASEKALRQCPYCGKRMTAEECRQNTVDGDLPDDQTRAALKTAELREQ